MDRRAAFIISLIMAVIAVLMVKTYISNQKAKATKNLDLVTVVVAGKTILRGEALSESNLKKGQFPEKYVGEREVRADNVSMILGKKVLNNLEEGKPVLWSDVELEKSEGFASVIKPGMRAVTVPVSSLSSISNMIRPGSRVDLLLTFDKSRIEAKGEVRKQDSEIPDMKDIQAFREYLMQKYSKPGDSRQMTVLLKQNVLVLAVGQKFMGDEMPSRKQESYSEITLLATPAASQEIVHALTMGQISFILRNDTDVEKNVVTPSTDDSVFRSAITASISQKEEESAPEVKPAEAILQVTKTEDR